MALDPQVALHLQSICAPLACMLEAVQRQGQGCKGWNAGKADDAASRAVPLSAHPAHALISPCSFRISGCAALIQPVANWLPVHLQQEGEWCVDGSRCTAAHLQGQVPLQARQLSWQRYTAGHGRQ